MPSRTEISPAGTCCTGAVDGCRWAACDRGKEALLLDRSRILNIIWAMGESLIVLSPDAEVWFANRATENMLGYEPGELVGKMLGEVVSDENLEFFSALRSMITKGPVRDLRLSYISRDGGNIPVSLNGSALRDDATGRFMGMVLVARDMRDMLGLVRNLEEAKAELEKKVRERTKELEEAYLDLKNTQAQLLQSEKMASVGQLAAGVAHEINNPVGFVLSNLGTVESYINDLLRLVRGYGEIFSAFKSSGCVPEPELRKAEELEKSADLDFILDDAIAVIKESREGAERIRAIVADLKDFSHVDSTEFVYADINSCIESTLNIACNELKHKARIIKEYGAMPKIKCNSGELNQVFMNLLVNAGQAIEGRGEIRIRTLQRENSVFVEISDTGHGIPPENLKRIFDPFFTTKPVGVGTGLGLTMAYKIIKRHNGEVSVNSTVGKGTVFIVQLPAEADGTR